MFFHNILPTSVDEGALSQGAATMWLLPDVKPWLPDADGTSTASPCRSAPCVQVGGTQCTMDTTAGILSSPARGMA